MISESKIKKLVAGRKVLIDTNIIIYLTDSIQPYVSLSKLLFNMIEAGDAQAVISLLSISEVMQGPLRKGYKSIAFDVRDYLVNFPNCHCQEITLGVLEHIGTDHRVDWQGLRTMDALIVASGLYKGADTFISNDKHFKKSIQQDMFLSLDQ